VTVPRRLPIAWIHLTVLWALAVVKPLFDVLADSPEFFVARGNTAADILILAFGITLLPPTLMAAVELAVWKIEPARAAVHLVLVGLLVAAIAVQVLDDLSGSAALVIALGVGVGALAAVAYARTRFVPSVLTVLGPLPALFLALLLVFSPVSKLVFGTETDALANVEVEGQTPVVMVVFDELSLATLMDTRHRIDTTRYPNIARLAGDSTWYRGATTVADVTTRALPAILTGSPFEPGTLPIAADYPRNLFTLLGEHYSLDVDESATKLCPSALCRSDAGSVGHRLDSLVSDLSLVSAHLLLPRDLESDLPRVDQTFSDFGGGDGGGRPVGRRARFFQGLADILAGRGAAFDGFVAGVRPSGARPGLDFLHVQLPHIPWEYLPSGARYAWLREPMPFPGNDEWPDDPAIPRLGLQRYLLQLRYVDTLIGDLLERLRRTGLYDRSLVVVTADHGLAFDAGRPRRTLTRRTFAEIAGIPLIVKAPGQRSGRIDDAPVRNTDILPTMADHLGVELPWRTAGRSVRETDDLHRTRLAVDSRDNPPGVTVGVESYMAELDRAVARLVRRLGPGDGARGLYALDDQDVLGRRADGLSTGPRRKLEVELSGSPPVKFADERTARPTGFVEGRLSGDPETGERLALEVNGRVAAVTLPYRVHGHAYFWAPLLPGMARRGSNDVEVLSVRGHGAGRRFAEIPARVRDRLSVEDGRTEIVTPDGTRIDVTPDAVKGGLDKVVSLGGNALYVEGWAADVRAGAAGRPADRVLVFSDGELLVEGVPSRARPDVAEAQGAGTLRSGFRLSVATGRSRAIARKKDFRVFAISGGHASELPPTENIEILG
jgi:hypothetical protein